jgi:hypothetical protein
MLELIVFIVGAIAASSGTIPPFFLGGNPTYTLLDGDARTLGRWMLVPLPVAVIRFCFINAAWPLLIEYGVMIYVVVQYYQRRYRRPATPTGFILDTEVPADQLPLFDSVVSQSSRSIFLVILSLITMSGALFGPFAIWQSVDAISRSGPHSFLRTAHIWSWIALITAAPVTVLGIFLAISLAPLLISPDFASGLVPPPTATIIPIRTSAPMDAFPTRVIPPTETPHPTLTATPTPVLIALPVIIADPVSFDKSFLDEANDPVFDDGRLVITKPRVYSEGGSPARTSLGIYTLNVDGAGWMFLEETLLEALQQHSVILTNPVIFDEQVAISGDRMAVGSVEYPSQDSRDGVGTVTIYRRQPNGAWFLEARLTHPDGLYPVDFGAAVALEGDTLVVGAPFLRDDTQSGEVFVYRNTGSGWDLDGRLQTAYPGVNHMYGAYLALHDSTVLVGSDLYSSDDLIQRLETPYVDVFQRADDGWHLRATIARPAGAGTLGFGSMMDSEGRTIVISAIDQSIPAVGGPEGKMQAYVFADTSTAGDWSEFSTTRLIPVDADPANLSGFGRSLALEGDTLVISDPYHQGASPGTTSGAVYVYRLHGDTWVPEALVQGTDHGYHADEFGRWLALDNGLLLVRCIYANDYLDIVDLNAHR